MFRMIEIALLLAMTATGASAIAAYHLFSVPMFGILPMIVHKGSYDPGSDLLAFGVAAFATALNAVLAALLQRVLQKMEDGRFSF